MVSTWSRAVAVAASTAVGLTLAGCSAGDQDSDGGTLTVLHHQPYESADPQRIYVGAQLAHFRRLVDRALAADDVEEQTGILQEANEVLARDVAYIPLDVSTTNWVHGSKVTGFTATAASNHFPEIGLIGVED